MDLRATVERNCPATIRGIARQFPPTDRVRGADHHAIARVIEDQGGRLETSADLALYDAIRMSACQPDTDRAAFSGATAILLADLLQDGLGRDDLADYWAALQPAYSALPPHDRAAILQGYLTAADLGRVRCPTLPHVQSQVALTSGEARAPLLACARREMPALQRLLEDRIPNTSFTCAAAHLQQLVADEAEPLSGDSPIFAPLLYAASLATDPCWSAATAILLAEAIRTGDAEGWFAVTLWADHAANWFRSNDSDGRAIHAGLRYLYEADRAWVPIPEVFASPDHAHNLPLLPSPDACIAE
ncbi:hypothetical protein [Tropicimonas marinistellae]|uniref:hypothetical protein n=1 Tax=Tropicimonas marinistellae TaxID=1739787 RepID=UPI00122E3A2D|nr:hypothetical protein [Tropicimonas marinistellae]